MRKCSRKITLRFVDNFFFAATVPCYLLKQNIVSVMATFLLTCDYASFSVPIKKKAVQRLFIGSVHLIPVHPYTVYPASSWLTTVYVSVLWQEQVNILSVLQTLGTDLN